MCVVQHRLVLATVWHNMSEYSFSTAHDGDAVGPEVVGETVGSEVVGEMVGGLVGGLVGGSVGGSGSVPVSGLVGGLAGGSVGGSVVVCSVPPSRPYVRQTVFLHEASRASATADDISHLPSSRLNSTEVHQASRWQFRLHSALFLATSVVTVAPVAPVASP